jgi:carotenoid cleavage dioxygenase
VSVRLVRQPAGAAWSPATRPCFVFRPLNATEDDNHIIVEVIRYERVFDRSRLRPDESAPTLWRWTLDLATRITREEQLDDVAEEFSRIGERRRTASCRHAHTVGLDAGSRSLFGGRRPREHDVPRNTVGEHDFGAGRETGEAVFVPKRAVFGRGRRVAAQLRPRRKYRRVELVVLDTAVRSVDSQFS